MYCLNSDRVKTVDSVHIQTQVGCRCSLSFKCFPDKNLAGQNIAIIIWVFANFFVQTASHFPLLTVTGTILRLSFKEKTDRRHNQ